MTNRVLLIAFHYPPFHGSSGHLRTLSFSRYLPEHGWDPIVLTAMPGAYPMISHEQMGEIPDRITVRRTFAMDARKQFSIRGAYPLLLALPDRWSSWWLSAVPAGLSLIRQYRPSVIWSTYPTPTAHLIAHTLHKLTSVPWVADFRDPMNGSDTVNHKNLLGRCMQWIERKAVHTCERAVFTTPGTASLYARRYADIPESRWTVIQNGYQDKEYAGLSVPRENSGMAPTPLRLLHSGYLYKEQRDPRPFFSAISTLLRSHKIGDTDLCIVLRGCGHEEYYRDLINAEGIDHIVRLAPSIPYREALEEMLAADVLLLFQGSSCNRQIPAKVYEYFWARRPILAMTDPAGDTAGLLRSVGLDTIASLDSSEEIAELLLKIKRCIRDGCAPSIPEETIVGHSRRSRAQQLAELFNGVACKD